MSINTKTLNIWCYTCDDDIGLAVDYGEEGELKEPLKLFMGVVQEQVRDLVGKELALKTDRSNHNQPDIKQTNVEMFNESNEQQIEIQMSP